MMKAVAVLTIVFCGACLFASTQQRSAASAPGRPNILLIISDDIGLDVMTNVYPGLIDDLTRKYGASGLNHPEYRAISGRPASTPNLDQLARQGVAFTNAWAQPFCSPTRASILTGFVCCQGQCAHLRGPAGTKLYLLCEEAEGRGWIQHGTLWQMASGRLAWHSRQLSGYEAEGGGLRNFQGQHACRNQDLLGLRVSGAVRGYTCQRVAY